MIMFITFIHDLSFDYYLKEMLYCAGVGSGGGNPSQGGGAGGATGPRDCRISCHGWPYKQCEVRCSLGKDGIISFSNTMFFYCG